MNTTGVILDAQGNPTGNGGNPRDEGIQPSVQALIESRLNAAIADIREHNRDDLQDIAREHVKKWRHIAVISWCFSAAMAIFGIITWFIAPQQVASWIGQQVDRKLTEPMIKESADRVINDKMTLYVTTKLQPINQQSEKLSRRIEKTETEIAAKQAILSSQQARLGDQLGIAELAVSAKAGSRNAYETLLQNASHNQSNDFLRASMRDLEFFYDSLWSQDRYVILVQADTMADPGYSSDEMAYQIIAGPDYCEEAAINSLGRTKPKATVGALCARAKETKNLHAASRAIWALQEITGEKFRPLAFESVDAWWQRNQTNAVYCGNYTAYCGVVKSMYQPPWSSQQLEQYIGQLNATIETDPDALHARCLKAGFLIMLGRSAEAQPILDEVRKKRADYYWLYLWDAAASLKTN
ncbi:MAG: hypothetical protein WC328_11700, partial [Kiritimatiellia bacterium]